MPNFPKHMKMLPYRGEVRRQFDVESDVIRLVGFDGNAWVQLGGVIPQYERENPREAAEHLHKLELDFKESLNHGKHRQPNQTNNSDPSETPSPAAPGAGTASSAGKNPGASPGKSSGASLTPAEVTSYLQALSPPSVSQNYQQQFYQQMMSFVQGGSRLHFSGHSTGRWASGSGGAGGAGGILHYSEVFPAPTIPHEGIQLGEIEAYRAWFLIDGKLRSMFKKTFWEPGQPMTGDISDGGGVHAWNSHDGTMIYVMEEANLNWNAEQTEQLAYKVHFSKASDYIDTRYPPAPPVIIGKLVLWGEVVHHKLGYRAEFARPTEFLQVLDVSRRGKHWDHDRSHEILSQLRSTYLTPPTE